MYEAGGTSPFATYVGATPVDSAGYVGDAPVAASSFVGLHRSSNAFIIACFRDILLSSVVYKACRNDAMSVFL